jgi:hypothetical protein
MVTWYWNLQCVPFVSVRNTEAVTGCPGDVGFLCNRAAVFGAAIQKRLCSFLRTALPRMVYETHFIL